MITPSIMHARWGRDHPDEVKWGHNMDMGWIYAKAGGDSTVPIIVLLTLYPANLFSFSSVFLIYNIPLHLPIYSQWLTKLLCKLTTLSSRFYAILTVC